MIIRCDWFLRYLEPFALLSLVDPIMRACNREFGDPNYCDWEAAMQDGRVAWTNSQWVVASAGEQNHIYFEHEEVDEPSGPPKLHPVEKSKALKAPWLTTRPPGPTSPCPTWSSSSSCTFTATSARRTVRALSRRVDPAMNAIARAKGADPRSV